jgi:hypothetical protein
MKIMFFVGFSLIIFLCSTSIYSQPRGYALSFDGVDDYVEVADDPSLDITDGFTIVAWIYLESYTEWATFVTKGGVVNDGGALTPNNYAIHQSGPSHSGGASGGEFGHLRFTGSSPALPDPLLESNTQIPLNEWHYVAITYDGTTLRFYLDGIPDGGGLLPGPLDPNDDPLHIGVDFPGGDEYWSGLIDEVRIWNRALKPAHVRAAMNGHAAPLASALVGYWRFDEGSGNRAKDKSREKNHGTLVNGPTWVTPGAPIGGAKKNSSVQSEVFVASEFYLEQNYPNPFNPTTDIRFSLAEATHVNLSLYNSAGQLIKTLVSRNLDAGYHSFQWDATNDNGQEVAAGVYLYRLTAGKYIDTKKMVLMK